MVLHWHYFASCPLFRRFQFRSRRLYALCSLPFLVAGFLLIQYSSQFVSVLAVYLSFLGAMLVWGWLEYVFLIGVITGPNNQIVPRMLQMLKVYQSMGDTSLSRDSTPYSLGSIFYLCWSAENMFGLWTFVILYFARICAKLNLFFGVPRINVNLYRRLYLIYKSF